jgi:hypothetical protein
MSGTKHRFPGITRAANSQSLRHDPRPAFMAAPGPNPVLGMGERVSIGAFLLWVAVLAAVLWKRPAVDGPSKG